MNFAPSSSTNGLASKGLYRFTLKVRRRRWQIQPRFELVFSIMTAFTDHDHDTVTELLIAGRSKRVGANAAAPGLYHNAAWADQPLSATSVSPSIKASIAGRVPPAARIFPRGLAYLGTIGGLCHTRSDKQNEKNHGNGREFNCTQSHCESPL